MSQFKEQNNVPIGGNLLSVPRTSRDFSTSSDVTSSNTINTSDLADTVTSLTRLMIFLVVLYVIFIVVTIMAFSKTSNQNLKVFLILGIFLPPIAPITFILALMIIFGGLK